METKHNKIVGCVIGIVVAVLVALIFLPMVEDAKDDWRYYADEDYRKLLDFAELGVWGMVIFGAVDFVFLLVFAAQDDQHVYTRATASAAQTHVPSAPIRRIRGRVLEKTDEIQYSYQTYEEWIVMEDEDGNQMSLRNTRPREIHIRVGDSGVFMIQGETISSFKFENNADVSAAVSAESSAALQTEQPQNGRWVCNNCKTSNPPQTDACVRCGTAKNATTVASKGLKEILAYAIKYSTEEGARGYLTAQMHHTREDKVYDALEEILRTPEGMLQQVLGRRLHELQRVPCEETLVVTAPAATTNAENMEKTYIFCPECGARSESTAKFCRTCGYKLN